MRKSSKWEKRILIAVLVLLVVIIGGHAIWSHLASKGVQSRVAAIKTAGEPILPADFATINPDAPDNAGPDITAAAELAAAYDGKNARFERTAPAIPLKPFERSGIEAAVRELAPALDRLEQATKKPRAQWKLDLSSPVLFNVMLPKLTGDRALCRLLCSAALLDHENGADASAIERLDRAIFISRYEDKHPSVVGHLIAIGCLAMVSNNVIEIAPDLKIGSAKGDASPQDVQGLIALLLDDAPPREGLRLAFRGERMAEYDAVESILGGAPLKLSRDKSDVPGTGSAVARYIFRPPLHHNASFMLDHMTAMLKVVDEPDYPAAKAKIAPPPEGFSPLRMLAVILLPAMEKAVETHHRATSDRRLAATALAIRWYAVEHEGKRPEKLADLVPKYLPAVPKDALLRDKPLGYIPDPVDPKLYSAGANGKDDGGSEAFERPQHRLTTRPANRGDEWETLDRVVHLNRQPRAEPEPEMPSDDEPADLTTSSATTEPAP